MERNPELQFDRAQPADAPRIMEIIEAAKAQMHARGSAQWQDGYPALRDIQADIVCGRGVVALGMTGGRRVIAYAALAWDGEPAYDEIEGRWLTDGPYVVVHRLAVADEAKGRGVATALLRYVESTARAHGIPGFRIDTAFDNLYMQRMLRKLDFTYCGRIRYRSGERLAYEKALISTNSSVCRK